MPPVLIELAATQNFPTVHGETKTEQGDAVKPGRPITQSACHDADKLIISEYRHFCFQKCPASMLGACNIASYSLQPSFQVS